MSRRMTYLRHMADENLDETLFIRIAKADKELLERIAENLPLKPSGIARIALRIGLAAIEKDPSVIFAGAKATKKGGR